jgi:hypothetical protein
MKEAGEDGAQKSPDSAKKITNWVKQISKKIPMIQKLEKKLGMLQGLDPVLESVMKDLNKVTDFSHLRKLQAQLKKKQEAEEEE